MSKASSHSPTAEEIANSQWRYVGYDGFSKFIASANNFFIFRKFGALNARALLILQDELAVLEDDLKKLDEECIKHNNIHNGSFRDDANDTETSLGQRRSKLNVTIISKLKEYNDFVIQVQQLRASAPVSPREIANISYWFSNHKNAIHDEEQAYIKQTSDLMSLENKTKTPFRRTLERSTHFRTLNFWKDSHLESPMDKHSSELEHIASDEKIDTVIAISVVVAGLVMLIAPIWILQYVHPVAIKLGVISAFLVIFVLLLGFATPARSFETVAAAAGYAAVLMVFLQTST